MPMLARWYRGAPLPAIPDPGVSYVVTHRDPDIAYPSMKFRRHGVGNAVFLKESLQIIGQDRETGFISALRKLYRTMDFPEVKMVELMDLTGKTRVELAELVGDEDSLHSTGYFISGEFEHIPRQLIGFPDYGVRMHARDEKTNYIVEELPEHPGVKRIRTYQALHSDYIGLDKSEGPRQLCEALRDAICGLLNLFRMGYMHRDIRPLNVMMAKSRTPSEFGYMLSEDGRSVEGNPRFFTGFLFDFLLCKKLDGDDDLYDGDTDTMELDLSTPTSILTVENRSDYVHSPIYDLDSFLWMLLSAATTIICDYMSGERTVKLDDPEYVAAWKAKEELKKAAGTQQPPPARPSRPKRKANGIDLTNPKEGCEHFVARDEFGRVMFIATLLPSESKGDRTDEDVNGPAERENAAEEPREEVRSQDSTDKRPEPEKKQEGSDEDDAEYLERLRRAAKGKRKVTIETVEESESDDGNQGDDENKANDSASYNDDDDFEPPHPDIWYYKPMGAYTLSISKPTEYPRPPGFEASGKAQFVAFAEDRIAHIINVLLHPRDIKAFAFMTGKSTRIHLVRKLEDFLNESHGLAPFKSLILRLVAVGAVYYVPEAELAQGRKRTRDEIEEAFDAYLKIFDKFMPEEKNWYYLKEYEGSDILYKFNRTGCLGGFASPAHHKAA